MDLRIFFMRCCTSLVATLFFYPYAATDDNTYSWQPVQQNMRARDDDYQNGISNEGACKTRCVENQDCIGVDWHAGFSSCFLFWDSGASPYSANGYSHWRITRNRSTPTSNQATLKTATTSVRIGISSPTEDSNSVTSGLTLRSEKSSSRQPRDIANEDIDAVVVDDYLATWQPVQLNVRARTGDFQPETTLNEAGCKSRCVQNPKCLGIDWHNSSALCFLVYNCNASLYTENEYSHWEIKRYKATPITCQDLVGRHEAQLHPTTPVSGQCSSPENWITVLSVLLGIFTLVVAGLMCNTWRLQQKIRSCTCDLKKANFLQAQANGYQSYDGPINQPTVYTDIARTLPPIPTDNEIVYADIDDVIRL